MNYSRLPPELNNIILDYYGSERQKRLFQNLMNELKIIYKYYDNLDFLQLSKSQVIIYGIKHLRMVGSAKRWGVHKAPGSV